MIGATIGVSSKDYSKVDVRGGFQIRSKHVWKHDKKNKNLAGHLSLPKM